MDIKGYELNLFSGNSSATNAPSGASYFYSADSGTFQSKSLPIIPPPDSPDGTASLIPEPGRLQLPGTGLLCRGLVVFRRAAKRTARPVLNAYSFCSFAKGPTRDFGSVDLFE